MLGFVSEVIPQGPKLGFISEVIHQGSNLGFVSEVIHQVIKAWVYIRGQSTINHRLGLYQKLYVIRSQLGFISESMH